MIGDRSHDMVGAKNNGMKGIGVLYGYGSRDELLEAGAQHVCATPRRDPRLHFLSMRRPDVGPPEIRAAALTFPKDVA